MGGARFDLCAWLHAEARELDRIQQRLAAAASYVEAHGDCYAGIDVTRLSVGLHEAAARLNDERMNVIAEWACEVRSKGSPE